MTEYKILAQIDIDTKVLDAKLKAYKPTITAKVKMDDAEKLATSLGKIDNQLAKIKINNKDAFANSPEVRAAYANAENLRNSYEKGATSIGKYQVAYGQLGNEVAKYNQDVRTTINNTDNFATSIGKAVTKIALWGVATGLLYGSLKKIQEGVQYIKDLNQEMTNIGLVTNQTTEQLSGTALEFNDKAKELGVTTLSVAQGYTEWARQGRTAADSMTLLTNSTKLAALGDLDAADATTKLTAAINAYGISVEDSIKVVDTITALDQAFATSTAEIADAMEESSSMARQAGIEYQNLASYISIISSITRQSGDTIGNAVKSIAARMLSVKAGVNFDEQGESLNNVEKVLKKYDIALRDSTDSFRDLDDVLADAAKKYNELGAAGKTAAQGQITSALAG